MTLTDFLFARIAEDEAGARAVVGDRNAWDTPEWDASRWSPWRVLDECEAKRRIVDEHAFMAAHESRDFGFSNGNCLTCRVQGPCATLLHLATVYADHSDYDEAWRP